MVTGGTRRTFGALGTIPGLSLGTPRPGGATFAVISVLAGRTIVTRSTLRAIGPGISNLAFVSLRTNRPNRSSVSSRTATTVPTVSASKPFVADHTIRASGTCGSGWSKRARSSRSAAGSWGTLCALGSGNAIGAVDARRTD